MAKFCLTMIFSGLATTTRTVHAVAESQEGCVDSTCATVDVSLLQQTLKMASEIARDEQVSADDDEQAGVYKTVQGKCQHAQELQDLSDNCDTANLKSKCDADPQCTNFQVRPDKGHCLISSWPSEAGMYGCTYTTYFKEVQPECVGGWQQGDGAGQESSVSRSATSQTDCIDLVKTECPDATGATLHGSGKGHCVCELGMTVTNRFQSKTSGWISCLFAMQAPTASPTSLPTQSPTESPTPSPTESPTAYPTTSPTDAPTVSPTPSPTDPTQIPTSAPTCSPQIVIDGGVSIAIEVAENAHYYVASTCPCPEGDKIDDPAECAAAACSLGKEWNVMKAGNSWPKHVSGCAQRNGPVDYGIYFNKHPVGGCTNWAKAVCLKH